MTGIATISFKDIPPYVMAAGNTAKPYGLNTKGLKRRGFSVETMNALRRAYKVLYKSGFKLEEAIQELAQIQADCAEVAYLTEFVKETQRGIIR